MSPYAYLPMLTHLVCLHTLTYQSSVFGRVDFFTNSGAVLDAKCDKVAMKSKAKLNFQGYTKEWVEDRKDSLKKDIVAKTGLPETAITAMTFTETTTRRRLGDSAHRRLAETTTTVTVTIGAQTESQVVGAATSLTSDFVSPQLSTEAAIDGIPQAQITSTCTENCVASPTAPPTSGGGAAGGDTSAATAVATTAAAAAVAILGAVLLA